MGRAAGVVDENVDGPQCGGQRRECALDLRGFGDIGDGGGKHSWACPELGQKALHRRLLVDRRDFGALVDKVAAEALPDATCRAGDSDDLAFEFHAMFPRSPCPQTRLQVYPFNAPSMRPLKNSRCANVNAMMPGVTTIT